MPCCVTKFLGKQHHVKWGLFKVKNSIDNTIAEGSESSPEYSEGCDEERLERVTEQRDLLNVHA